MRFVSLALAGMLAISLSASAAMSGAGEPLDCWEGPAVLSQRWALVSLAARNQIPLGEWKLPVSSSRPDSLTEARISLSLVRDSLGEPWRMRFVATFPESMSVGLPYNFKGAIVRYSVGSVERVESLDWTQDCVGTGREILPNGAALEEDLKLPGLDGLLARDLRIEIFGIRF